MANIMLTYRCNLKCPYCFANEFVNHTRFDISLDNFKTALNFLKTSDNKHIGLIGGEPTLHRDFRQILQILAEDENIDSVTIYTNGLLVDEYLDFLENQKFSALINCNSPADIGEKAFGQLKENLQKIFRINDVWKRVNLGINLYSNDFDYTYIFDLLKSGDLHRVRMSVTVPNMEEGKKQDSLEYLESRKNYVLQFMRDCAKHDIAPYYDCNVIPSCLWSEEQLQEIEQIIQSFHLKRTNLRGDQGFCRPVIDILPNLTAVRCFGTSDFTKVNINDFECLNDLSNYYINLVDRHITSCLKSPGCKGCYQKSVLKCTAGCMAFARDMLLEKLELD